MNFAWSPGLSLAPALSQAFLIGCGSYPFQVVPKLNLVDIDEPPDFIGRDIYGNMRCRFRLNRFLDILWFLASNPPQNSSTGQIRLIYSISP